MAMKNNYPSQKNRSTLAISPLRLEQAKKLAELRGEGWTARLVVEALIKDAIRTGILNGTIRLERTGMLKEKL